LFLRLGCRAKPQPNPSSSSTSSIYDAWKSSPVPKEVGSQVKKTLGQGILSGSLCDEDTTELCGDLAETLAQVLRKEADVDDVEKMFTMWDHRRQGAKLLTGSCASLSTATPGTGVGDTLSFASSFSDTSRPGWGMDAFTQAATQPLREPMPDV